MKHHAVSNGETLMRERLAAQLLEQDKLSRKMWKRPEGLLYRYAKVVYYMVAVYSFMICLLNEIIFLVMHRSGYAITQQEQAFYRSNSYIVHSLFFLLVVAFLLMCLKQVKAACGVQLAAGVLLGIQISQVFVGEYSNQTLLGVLYCVVALAVFAAAILLFVLIFHHNRMERLVAKEYQKLYARYGNAEDGMMNQEHLERIVLTYETALKNGQTPPKSID